MADFYQILGVAQTASDSEIKTAYRRLAKQYHPDKNPDNEYADERFKQINEAYQTLSDRIKKAQYDAVLNYARTHAYQSNARQNYRSKPNPSNRRRGNRPPTPPKVKPLTPEQKARIAQRRRETHIKAFNRMAIFVSIFLVIFGTVVGVIETERAQDRARAEQLIKERIDNINRLVAQFENALNTNDFVLAYQSVYDLEDLQYRHEQFKARANNALLKKGDEVFEEQNYAQALNYYELLMEHSTIHSQLIPLRIANCYLQTGDVIGAETAFSNACDILIAGYIRIHGQNYYYNMNPENLDHFHFEAFMGKGIASYTNGNYKESLNAFNFANYLRPQQSVVFKYLAQVHEKLGNIEETQFNKQISDELLNATTPIYEEKSLEEHL